MRVQCRRPLAGQRQQRLFGPRLGRAIDGAQTTLGAVLAKARFWERFQSVPLNARQRLVLNRLLDGFEGKLTTSKYARLAKCSQDTALRDILPLLEHGILHGDALTISGETVAESLKAIPAEPPPAMLVPRSPRFDGPGPPPLNPRAPGCGGCAAGMRRAACAGA